MGAGTAPGPVGGGEERRSRWARLLNGCLLVIAAEGDVDHSRRRFGPRDVIVDSHGRVHAHRKTGARAAVRIESVIAERTQFAAILIGEVRRDHAVAQTTDAIDLRRDVLQVLDVEIELGREIGLGPGFRQQPAERLFRSSVAVLRGGVEPVDAARERAADRSPLRRVVLVDQGPADGAAADREARVAQPDAEGLVGAIPGNPLRGGSDGLRQRIPFRLVLVQRRVAQRCAGLGDRRPSGTPGVRRCEDLG